MTLVREAGASKLVDFTVPYKGTWSSVAANQLSPDTLYSSLNVFLREGKLRQRPGLELLVSTVFDGPVLGGAMAVTPTQKILLAITSGVLYTHIAGASGWVVDTTATLASASDNVDITFLETSSQYVAVISAPGFVLKRWIQGSGASVITAVAGTVPTAISVCTAARRIVALVDPHTVVWTTTLTYDNWPALAFAKLAQTNDRGICVRSLSNLTFVVYKERSIYLARAQAGSDAAAFAFAEPIIVEGPAGTHSVVQMPASNGIVGHMYMTTNGRVALFDGTRYPQFILDGLWIYLQGDIDPQYADNIFGVIDYRLHTVTFHYPRNGDAGLMYGCLIINLPLEGSGVTSYAGFLGITSKPVSYGYEMRFNNQIDRSLLFTSTVGDAQSFTFDETVDTDDSVPFNCAFQTPLFPLPDLRHHHISTEIFLERADGYGSMTITPVVSDVLENAGGTQHPEYAQRIDLNNNPVQEHVGYNSPTRFIGLLCEWSSDSTVRYAGSALYGRLLS